MTVYYLEPVRVLEGTCLRGGSGASTSARGVVRARHASAGDVLAPLMRPHSAALSGNVLLVKKAILFKEILFM